MAGLTLYNDFIVELCLLLKKSGVNLPIGADEDISYNEIPIRINNDLYSIPITVRLKDCVTRERFQEILPECVKDIISIIDGKACKNISDYFYSISGDLHLKSKEISNVPIEKDYIDLKRKERVSVIYSPEDNKASVSGIKDLFALQMLSASKYDGLADEDTDILYGIPDGFNWSYSIITAERFIIPLIDKEDYSLGITLRKKMFN